MKLPFIFTFALDLLLWAGIIGVYMLLTSCGSVYVEDPYLFLRGIEDVHRSLGTK